MDFYKIMERRRLELGLSYKDLSKLVGAKSANSAWVACNKVTHPSPITISKYCKALNLNENNVKKIIYDLT